MRTSDTIGYDIENLTDPERSRKYHGAIVTDYCGRKIPKHSHGTANLGDYTSSTKKILEAVTELYDRIAGKDLLNRRLNITANRVIGEKDAAQSSQAQSEQMDMVTDYTALQEQRKKEDAVLAREKRCSLQCCP